MTAPLTAESIAEAAVLLHVPVASRRLLDELGRSFRRSATIRRNVTRRSARGTRLRAEVWRRRRPCPCCPVS